MTERFGERRVPEVDVAKIKSVESALKSKLSYRDLYTEVFIVENGEIIELAEKNSDNIPSIFWGFRSTDELRKAVKVLNQENENFEIILNQTGEELVCTVVSRAQDLPKAA